MRKEEDVADRRIIALVVGSLGFKNDYDIVSLPGTRRSFINIWVKIHSQKMILRT